MNAGDSMFYCVTGGAGFIGSNFIKFLNSQGIDNILVVDELSSDERWKNLIGLKFWNIVTPSEFLKDGIYVDKNGIVFHFGAISSTTEKNAELLLNNNVRYTERLLNLYGGTCKKVVVASSASVYGSGINGFDDSEEWSHINSLRPLNPYGFSKLLVDKSVKMRLDWSNIVSLRFFNVWGPKESHKKEQASLISRITSDVREKRTVKLFCHPDKKLARDFIYVDDVCKIAFNCAHSDAKGIYNVGTGVATEWKTLVETLAQELNVEPNIEYEPIPQHLLEHYQFITQANIEKLKSKIELPNFDLRQSIRNYLKEI